jgi:hypothetical protein
MDNNDAQSFSGMSSMSRRSGFTTISLGGDGKQKNMRMPGEASLKAKAIER